MVARKKKSAAPPNANEPALPAEKQTRETLLKELLEHRDQGRIHYEIADKMMDSVISLTRGEKHERILKHPVTGEKFKIVDNFATKNLYFKPCGVRRYEVKPVKGTRKPK